MENATKALLIAAAVLITIVLVAVGVLLIGNTSDVSDQADKAGNSISTVTEEAVIDMQGGVYLSSDEFKKFIDDFGYPQYKDERIYASSVLVSGYLFKGYARKVGDKQYSWYNEKSVEVTMPKGKDLVDKWIPEQLKNGQIKAFKNPGNAKKTINEYKTYKNSIEELKDINKLPCILFCFLDENGDTAAVTGKEVTKVVYVVGAQK